MCLYPSREMKIDAFAPHQHEGDPTMCVICGSEHDLVSFNVEAEQFWVSRIVNSIISKDSDLKKRTVQRLMICKDCFNMHISKLIFTQIDPHSKG